MIINILISNTFFASGTSAWNVNSFKQLFCKWRWRDNFLSLKVRRSPMQNWHRCIFYNIMEDTASRPWPVPWLPYSKAPCTSSAWPSEWARHPFYHFISWSERGLTHATKSHKKKALSSPIFQSQPPIRVAPHYKEFLWSHLLWNNPRENSSANTTKQFC